MTDNEMLLLAAKADGLELIGDCVIPAGGLWILKNGRDTYWNPLLDDGEALRLANNLNLSIEFTSCQDDAPVVWVRDGYGYEERHCNFPDPYKATRRAIVIAAAEYQKKYEENTK
jgi:hypothetical protein